MTLLARRIFSLMILGFTPTVWGNPKPSVKEYRTQISQHRQRILDFGSVLFHQFRSHFPSLDGLPPHQSKLLIETYLSLHDLPKLMTRHQLEELDYHDRKTLFRYLYDSYGKAFSPQPQFIHTLNETEDQLKEKVMKRLLAEIPVELHPGIMNDLQIIEKTVDFTDTKILRGEELGFKPIRYAAANFLISLGLGHVAPLSRWLEDNLYAKIPRSCGKIHN